MPIITMPAPTSRARSFGGVELVAHLGLVAHRAVAREAARRHVDLEVEPAELLDERRVVDLRRAPRCCAAPGRPSSSTRLSSTSMPVIGVLEVEPGLGEHPGEDVQAAVDLVAVALPVLAREGPARDVIAHGGRLPYSPILGRSNGRCRAPWRAGYDFVGDLWRMSTRLAGELSPCVFVQCR